MLAKDEIPVEQISTVMRFANVCDREVADRIAKVEKAVDLEKLFASPLPLHKHHPQQHRLARFHSAPLHRESRTDKVVSAQSDCFLKEVFKVNKCERKS